MSLITSTSLKNYLGVTSTDYDAKITLIVDGVNAFVAKYCNRTFAATAREEYLDGGVENLPLSHAPVNSITSITDEEDDSAVVSSSDYDYDPDLALVFFKAPVTTAAFVNEEGKLPWGAGRRRWKVSYNAGEAGDADLVLAALQIAAGRFNRVDPGLGGEKDGDYSYTVDLSAFTLDGLAPEVAATLGRHRFYSPGG